MKKGTYLEQVREQYENYPYPEREPEDEKGVLHVSTTSSLDCINHFCFGGERDFSKPFRVLIPGGGTGDCTIYLAEQLRGLPAEIVYLDMSQASMKIAQERAKVRQLDNIKWVHDSLLNLPNLGLGEFDFITCSGVLHHLSDPQAGLDALKAVLHPEGSIYIMVYAKYGRTSIYQMQELLRRIHKDEPDIQKRIDKTRVLLSALPEGNWYNFNSRAYGLDLKSDIGLYDLLLHTQDRAYSIPELYDYVKNSGLHINRLINTEHPLGEMLFKPESFIRDPAILDSLQHQSFAEKASIAEILYGQQMKQCCYISTRAQIIPDIKQDEFIPSIAISSSSESTLKALKLIFNSDSPKIQLNQFVGFNRSKFAAAIFNALDGVRTSREIVDHVFAEFKSTFPRELIESHYQSMLGIMIKVHLVFLRKKGVVSYPTIAAMNRRMYDYYGEDVCQSIYAKHKAALASLLKGT